MHRGIDGNLATKVILELLLAHSLWSVVSEELGEALQPTWGMMSWGDVLEMVTMCPASLGNDIVVFYAYLNSHGVVFDWLIKERENSN